MANKKTDYQALSRRLDEVLAAMQAADITVDEAITLYQEGTELVESLQKYLKEAENRITKLSPKGA